MAFGMTSDASGHVPARPPGNARIVFDLDGTLIDSAPDIQGVANALLADVNAAPLSLAEAHEFIGNGVGAFVERMCAARGLAASAGTAMIPAFEAQYVKAVHLTAPYPGVPTALRTLGRRYRLGICTNKPHGPALSVLRHLGLDTFFATVIGGDSLSLRKPDPAPLHAAFEALGDGRKIYVGDSEVDAETARRAGVDFLLFTRGYRKAPVEDLPYLRGFDDFADLPAQIDAVLGAAV